MAITLKNSLTAVLILSAGFLYTLIEVFADGEKVSTGEFILDSIEKSLLVTGVIGVFFIFRRMNSQQGEREKLLEDLHVAKKEGQQWRSRVRVYADGLGKEIEKQFDTWGLSAAESEVALLMVKGFSHKEIANLRGTAQATIRQQARSIYSKSGLPGKAAFSAYFLEDLLSPQGMNGLVSKHVNGAALNDASLQLINE